MPASAGAEGLESLPVTFTASVEAWPPEAVDSGWWPESGPVRVRTEVYSEGLATVTLAGTSVVDASTGSPVQRLEPSEGSVELSLDVGASLFLSLDVAGYTWDGLLREQTASFDVAGALESLAFEADGGETIRLEMEPQEIFSVEQSILPLVNVQVTGMLTPAADLLVSTNAVTSSNGAWTAAGQELPSSGGSVSMDADGTLDTQLSMVVQGHAEVCITFVDCYGDFNYDVELDTLQDVAVLDYAETSVAHTVVSSSGDDESGAGASGLDAEAGDKSADSGSGGCSAAPSDPLEWVWVFGVGLVMLRRRSPRASNTAPRGSLSARS